MSEKKIYKLIEEGKSTDFIVGRFLNKRTANKDEIIKIIKDYKWNKWRQNNEQ